MRKVVQWELTLALTVLLSVAAFVTTASGMPRETNTALPALHQERIAQAHNKRGLSRTILILENRTGIARLPRQTKEKLASMDDKEFRLVTKLCDRIAASGDKPGTDIAMLLAAVLIVLS
jgi:hypothetical protein